MGGPKTPKKAPPQNIGAAKDPLGINSGNIPGYKLINVKQIAKIFLNKTKNDTTKKALASNIENNRLFLNKFMAYISSTSDLDNLSQQKILQYFSQIGSSRKRRNKTRKN